jgi:hypothetical protein
MTLPENCLQDYELGNPLIRDSYTSMVAYAPVYTAGCLKDPNTSAYCFANAITNTSNPSMMYVYNLPLNMTLPGSTIPSCSQCLQQTMMVYHTASANRKQPIAYTYASAARQINTLCGPEFVNETLPAEMRLNAGSRGGPTLLATVLVPLLVVLPVFL